jgi:hypothetical protein
MRLISWASGIVMSPASRLALVEAVMVDASKVRLSVLMVILAGVLPSPSAWISVEMVELVKVTWLALLFPLVIKILPGLPAPLVKAEIVALSRLRLAASRVMLPESPALLVEALISTPLLIFS